MTFIVAQLGARRHYAVPRILHSAGLLEHFYTDISAIKGWPRLAHLVPPQLRPDGLRRLISRVPRDLPPGRVTAFNLLGLQYASRRRSNRCEGDQLATNIWAGKALCKLVERSGLGAAAGVHVFSSAGLELLKAARAQRRRGVLEQVIAPRRIEIELLEREHAAFPNWEPVYRNDGSAADFCAREEAEWDAADVILCGSEFVRDGILRCGGPADRAVVVPYGVDAGFTSPPRAPHNGPIRVLVVGAVGLRKGSPYVQAAATRLTGRAVFRMVGPLTVLPKARAALSAVVELTGPLPRSEIAGHFAWADLLLLPSLCEGSAVATYEALAAGLPVICTPNTGSVVRDGADGLIVPIRDADAIVEAIDRLASHPDMRRAMAESARKRAVEYDLSGYGRRLVATLQRCVRQGAR
jgi:glycosyltransferase involved in cell wall biosynthesis